MRLTKHHGLGNDFLVALDAPVDAGLAKRACDRRTGIGADGLIHVDHDMRMTLYNADGSRAEVSGNGLRCVGQALAMRAGADSLSATLRTDAGPRSLEVGPGPHALEHRVQVEMGDVEELELTEERARLSVGNPHLVLRVDDAAAVDPAVAGPVHGDDLNVEFVSLASPGSLEMRVWERGVGVTEACGTGACAAAYAGREWSLVGDEVEVRMPGGAALVTLDGASVTLTGPAVFVATIDYADE